jgi:hypothetical protein
VSADDQNLALFGDDSEPGYEPDVPGTVQLEPRPSRLSRWHIRTRWAVLACAALVVVGLTVGILVFNASAPDRVLGAASAKAAAQQYVAAVNAGNGRGAAAISCTEFADDARAAAASGKDPDITFSLDRIDASHKNDATVTVTEHLRFSGGTKQTEASRLSVLRSGGRWLMCGRVS